MLTKKGEREEAHVHAAAALARAEKLRERYWLATALWNSATLAFHEGNWEVVREQSHRGLAAQPRDPRHVALSALVEHQLGDVARGETDVERLQEIARVAPAATVDRATVAGFLPLIARVAAASLNAAETAAEMVLSSPRSLPLFAMAARIGSALIAVQRSDAGAAEALYAALEPQRGTALLFPPLAGDRLLGLLARTLGRPDDSVAHFEAALAFCERAGYRPEYAWTACDYADLLLDRAAPADRERAVALQDQALALARELGMRPLMERVFARRDVLRA